MRSPRPNWKNKQIPRAPSALSREQQEIPRTLSSSIRFCAVGADLDMCTSQALGSYRPAYQPQRSADWKERSPCDPCLVI
jgi:hypothetical protein